MKKSAERKVYSILVRTEAGKCKARTFLSTSAYYEKVLENYEDMGMEIVDSACIEDYPSSPGFQLRKISQTAFQTAASMNRAWQPQFPNEQEKLYAVG